MANKGSSIPKEKKYLRSINGGLKIYMNQMICGKGL